MSQVGGVGSGGGGGGGNLDTLTGNTGLAVGPDGSNNINIVGAGGVSVSGDPGTNTLTITASFTNFIYQTITGISFSMIAGNGYILTNTSMTTGSLPANGSTIVGDTVRVIGLSGGFTISQSANQQIIIGIDASTTGSGGSISVSMAVRNGLELVCVSNAGGVYIWTTIVAPQGNFTVV